MLTGSSTRGKTRRICGCAPTVAGLVEVEAHPVAVQIDDVGGAGAVDVGEADAPVVELVRVVEMGRMVHGDLGAEAAIAQVGPVADLAVADAHQVGQAVAAEVGQIDGLGAVGEDQTRALLFIQRLGDAAGRAEACFGQGGMPDEGVVFGDQHVGVAVAVQIHELQVRIAGVAIEARRERAEGLPAFIRRRARTGQAWGHPAPPGPAGRPRPDP